MNQKKQRHDDFKLKQNIYGLRGLYKHFSAGSKEKDIFIKALQDKPADTGCRPTHVSKMNVGQHV